MELVADNPNRWRDMLTNRSAFAITAVLDHLVATALIHVLDVEANEDILTGEQIWVVEWDATPSGYKARRREKAVIRFYATRDFNPMAEFYRRAEKRLKLFAELVRD